MSALSCMTLTDTELLSLSSRQTYNDAIIPSINTPVNPINIYTNIAVSFLSEFYMSYGEGAYLLSLDSSTLHYFPAEAYLPLKEGLLKKALGLL